MNSSENTVNVEKIGSEKPYLFVLSSINIPFLVKRVYWINFMIPHQVRGLHAHKKLEQIALCVNGEIDFKLTYKNGEQKDFKLFSDNQNALYIPPGVWRIFKAIKSESSLVVLASEDYEEDDYVRNYEEFLEN
jgi:dTDP-4-dehydrorhamnose 3,5-epimerase-like enzyme